MTPHVSSGGNVKYISRGSTPEDTAQHSAASEQWWIVPKIHPALASWRLPRHHLDYCLEGHNQHVGGFHQHLHHAITPPTQDRLILPV